jgi:hypothetical protein
MQIVFSSVEFGRFYVFPPGVPGAGRPAAGHRRGRDGPEPSADAENDST